MTTNFFQTQITKTFQKYNQSQLVDEEESVEDLIQIFTYPAENTIPPTLVFRVMIEMDEMVPKLTTIGKVLKNHQDSKDHSV